MEDELLVLCREMKHTDARSLTIQKGTVSHQRASSEKGILGGGREKKTSNEAEHLRAPQLSQTREDGLQLSSCQRSGLLCCSGGDGCVSYAFTPKHEAGRRVLKRSQLKWTYRFLHNADKRNTVTLTDLLQRQATSEFKREQKPATAAMTPRNLS